MTENKELSPEYRAALTDELGKITQKWWPLGHRGYNDPSMPTEINQMNSMEEQCKIALNRANEISLILEASKNGKNPDNYEPVGVSQGAITKELGFHPEDLLVPLFRLRMGGHIVDAGDRTRIVYRKKDVTANDAIVEHIWNKSLKWWHIAEDFSIFAQEVLNPVVVMQDLKKSQLQLGRSTAEFDEAIREIYAVLGMESSAAQAYIETNSLQKDLQTESKNENTKSQLPAELWDENKGWKWIDAISGFGRYYKFVDNPLEYLQKIRDSQAELGRSTQVFDEAITEIHAFLAQKK